MKKNIFLIIGILLAVGIILKVGYGAFSISDKQKLANTFSSGCLDITIENVSNAINMPKTKPITDVEGLETDGYTFKIYNHCDNPSNYLISLETLLDPNEATTLQDEFVRVALKSDTNDYILTNLTSDKGNNSSLEGVYKSYNLTSGVIGASKTKEFTLKEWMDYDTTKEQGAMKQFQSKINVTGGTNFKVNNNPEIKFTLDENNNMIGSLKGEATNIIYCKSGINECEPNIPISKENISVEMGEGKEIVCVKIDNGETICSDPTGTYRGAGTEENPYLVQAIEDLVTLSNEVNNGNTYEGKYFKLTRNLDFQDTGSYRDSTRTDYGDINGQNGAESLLTELTSTDGTGFPPIGNSTAFQGEFNGSGYTLSNLYIHNFDDATKRYALFGNVYNATIKNLELGGSVTTDVTRDIGGLVGYAKKSIFENIKTRVTVKSEVGSSSVGGLIGSVGEEEGSTNKIINCINYGDISNGNNTGGLAGYLANRTKLIIENSANYGTITNNLGQNLGGLLGRDNGSLSELEIKASHNYGEIKMIENNKDSTRGVGGIVGAYHGNLTINNSTNENKITVDVQGTGNVLVGGIIGFKTETNTTLNINNSRNTEKGIIYAKFSEPELYVGGILGCSSQIEVSVNLNNVHNKGKIKVENVSSNVVAGGIVGVSNGTTSIMNSSNEIETDNVESGIFLKNFSTPYSYLGGLVGRSHSPLKIENSYNTSDIDGGAREGGIVGEFSASSLIINRCYNIGNVTFKKEFDVGLDMGGIISNLRDGASGYVINSYNVGNVTLNSTINNDGKNSGIIGSIYSFSNSSVSKGYIINSYNIGEIISKIRSTGATGVSDISDLIVNNFYNLGRLNASNKYGILNSTSTGKIDINNAYYLNDVSASNVTTNGSNITINATGKSANDIKTQNFVNILNSNINSINLSEIDNVLSEYKLERWILGKDGYPTFNY